MEYICKICGFKHSDFVAMDNHVLNVYGRSMHEGAGVSCNEPNLDFIDVSHSEIFSVEEQSFPGGGGDFGGGAATSSWD